jgi:hypothetical protein
MTGASKAVHFACDPSSAAAPAEDVQNDIKWRQMAADHVATSVLKEPDRLTAEEIEEGFQSIRRVDHTVRSNDYHVVTQPYDKGPAPAAVTGAAHAGGGGKKRRARSRRSSPARADSDSDEDD